MSDDLERMLRPQRPERASAANPRLRVGPRLQGGQPLDGGPQLDLERSPVGPQATEPIGSGPTDTAPMDDAKEKSLSAGGPHLTIRRDEGHTPAESPQAVTTSHTARTTASCSRTVSAGREWSSNDRSTHGRIRSRAVRMNRSST